MIRFPSAPTPERLLVVDIETVPDRERLPAKSTGFPKPIYHKVACLSFVEARITTNRDGQESYAVTACRSGGEADWNERRILEQWWAYFSREPSRLVGWNSRGFDMPALLQRSMLHGLSAQRWFCGSARGHGYGYRYSDAWHCDLMDRLADYGACARLCLDETAAACGLPGKMVAHGSEVEARVAAGRVAEVRAYCEVDVLNTFLLYCRHALLTGRTTEQAHEMTIRSLVTYLDGENAVRLHLVTYLDGENAVRLHLGAFLEQWGHGRKAAAA